MIIITSFLCIFCLFVNAQCPRSMALNDYLANYEPNDFDLDELAFTGDIDNCVSGSYASHINKKMLDKINYLRRLVHLNDNVVFDPVLNQKCQEAAVMQEANRIINHCYGENDAPCSSWGCSSATAIEASQGSLLAFANWNYYDPIYNYMYDAGVVNTGVSHRRWLLYSKAKVFGNGLSENRNVLYVLGNSSNPSANAKDFMAYPTDGYMPAPIVFPRWSFTIPNAFFGNATVTMKDENNQTVNLEIIHKVGGPGEPTIAWEPDNIQLNNTNDVSYTITVSGIEDAPQISYTYTTIIFQPTSQPSCDNDTYWEEDSCTCVGLNNCPDHIFVTNQSLLKNLYAANILVSSNCNIVSSTTVEFNANSEIELTKNFEVARGADFLATIKACQ